MAWIARLLARWADAANVRVRLGAEADLKEQKQITAQRESRIALLEAEVEFLTQWRDKELATLKKEAAIARIATTVSQELPERE